MKKKFSSCLIFGTLLLFAANAWATTISLPMAGETVYMNETWGHNYGMQVTRKDSSNNDIVFTYNTFCVERYETFSNSNGSSHPYLVESVGGVATGGGRNFGNSETIGVKSGDPISDKSKWLYASFFDELFNPISTNKATLATKVQNAIWFLEDEIEPNSGNSWATDWNDLKAYNPNTDPENYAITGWNIQVVNLVYKDINGNTFDRQSQLVGVRVAHTPEPATMILFGIGLLAIASIGRKQMTK